MRSGFGLEGGRGGTRRDDGVGLFERLMYYSFPLVCISFCGFAHWLPVHDQIYPIGTVPTVLSR